jgi:hypothetical protein
MIMGTGDRENQFEMGLAYYLNNKNNKVGIDNDISSGIFFLIFFYGMITDFSFN